MKKLTIFLITLFILSCQTEQVQEASIKITQVGTGEKPGKIQLKGFYGAAANVADFSECKVGAQSDPNIIEIDCITESGLPINQFQTKLYCFVHHAG